MPVVPGEVRRAVHPVGTAAVAVDMDPAAGTPCEAEADCFPPSARVVRRQVPQAEARVDHLVVPTQLLRTVPLVVRRQVPPAVVLDHLHAWLRAYELTERPSAAVVVRVVDQAAVPAAAIPLVAVEERPMRTQRRSTRLLMRHPFERFRWGPPRPMSRPSFNRRISLTRAIRILPAATS